MNALQRNDMAVDAVLSNDRQLFLLSRAIHGTALPASA
jgi:hypothetical protein